MHFRHIFSSRNILYIPTHNIYYVHISIYIFSIGVLNDTRVLHFCSVFLCRINFNCYIKEQNFHSPLCLLVCLSNISIASSI